MGQVELEGAEVVVLVPKAQLEASEGGAGGQEGCAVGAAELGVGPLQAGELAADISKGQ